jgi:hypothetical protein
MNRNRELRLTLTVFRIASEIVQGAAIGPATEAVALRVSKTAVEMPATTSAADSFFNGVEGVAMSSGERSRDRAA